MVSVVIRDVVITVGVSLIIKFGYIQEQGRHFARGKWRMVSDEGSLIVSSTGCVSDRVSQLKVTTGWLWHYKAVTTKITKQREN